MVFLNRFFASVYLALIYASTANAIVQSPHQQQSTHRTRHIGSRGFKVEAYHPETTFQTFGTGLDQPASLVPQTLSEESVSFVKSRLGVDASNVSFKSGYSTPSTKVAYVKQAHNGVPFANAVANVAWKGNKVVSFGSSFVKSKKIAPSTPTIPVEAAVTAAEAALEGKYNNHPASLEYLARPDGSVSLTHVVQIQNEQAGTWYEAFVDAHSGDVLTVTDFVSDATYNVLPIEKETLPEGQEVRVDPHDLLSSPLAWHDDGTTKTTTTAGNNVIAYKGTQANVTSQSGADLAFNYTYNDNVAPTEGQNVDAARTNAFYAINTVHDFTYRYGFNEAAFNFQTNNFGKGGKGNDRVLMSVQDSGGTNNANFATPADGQSGTCRMYVWTYTPVRRDGSLENDIIVHEMTHGVTNRMTGGGTGRCLQTTEAGGMGEGWSDALAEWTQHKSSAVQDFVLGHYVTNNPKGIRTRPYSTNATTNPLRYSSIAALNEVHNIGEVWANMLHNVYAALVAKHGWSENARTNPEGTEGNIVYLHLFLDALALQPCNPTFVAARDAWIQADINRYNGENVCLIWKAFASRGLGVNAAKYVDDSSVPPACA
ncbi:hypothetical protein H0H81_004185 [Sphagnurus paluster]|uniref:Extracellular metalloproteinase n=1 Tax=Sphagnurus paluster TaxID=117069 RepID=A0A9P7FSL2_9AGAR|nr:hypothetical protein H0H81_004185 [Sphagnurus paluster]